MKKSQKVNEMGKVMDAVMNAMTSNTDFIAESEDQYFDMALPIFQLFNDRYGLTMKRIPPGVKKITPDGKSYIIDTYKGSNGKIFRMGYWENK